MVESFLDELNYNVDAKEFGSYFEEWYMNRVAKWAYCLRKATGMNTNMYLESIYKSIKYFYFNTVEKINVRIIVSSHCKGSSEKKRGRGRLNLLKIISQVT